MLYAAATLLQQCINCSITPHDTAVVNRDGAMPLPMVASFTISTAEEPAPECKLSVSLWSKVNKGINKIDCYKKYMKHETAAYCSTAELNHQEIHECRRQTFHVLGIKTNKGQYEGQQRI